MFCLRTPVSLIHFDDILTFNLVRFAEDTPLESVKPPVPITEVPPPTETTLPGKKAYIPPYTPKPTSTAHLTGSKRSHPSNSSQNRPRNSAPSAAVVQNRGGTNRGSVSGVASVPAGVVNSGGAAAMSHVNRAKKPKMSDKERLENSRKFIKLDGSFEKARLELVMFLCF